MKFLFILFLGYCVFIVLFAICGLFGLHWDVPIKESVKPTKEGNKKPTNLPNKVSKMEWVVVGNNTKLIEVRGTNSETIKLKENERTINIRRVN